MTNWRSTISGFVTSLAGLVLALTGAGVQEPHWLTVTAGFVMAGGFASMGIVGKDAAMHSTPGEVVAAGIDKKADSASA